MLPLYLLLAASHAVAALAGGSGPHAPALARGPSAKRQAGLGAGSLLIGESPIGLSMEYPIAEKALGSGPCPGHAVVQTFRELGSPALRIGGDSQDLAGPSAAYHYDIPASFWPVLGCFARETDAQISVGLNFATGTLADERTMIAAAEQAVPAAQLSFSLGNEPDLYGASHPLHSEPGYTVPPERPPTWSARAYAQEWTTRRALLGPIRLEGPDLAGNQWRVGVSRLLLEDPPNQIDAHIYPTSACGVGPPATSARLLSAHSSIEVLKERGWLVSIARAVHRPVIISESNSASCGGKRGVSDAPVASIWAVRFVVAALLAGFQQVRFHSAGTSYDPFVFNSDGTITRRPLASALLFLHRWIPIGSRLSGYSPAPQVFGASITRGRSRTLVLSSFAAHTLQLRLALSAHVHAVATDTLTTSSAADVRASLRAEDQEVRLALAPGTVVALSTW